ncbi:MAG: CoA transferase, partial [Candidatus Lambdaproteobacteria bacterium]|nr:CoA transferase [Candidatus Lambdaproteobacteria bacterium]
GNLFRHARSGSTDIYPEVAAADLLSGVFAAIGVLSALWARQRTGQGTTIDVSMSDCLVAANAILLAPTLNGAPPPDIMTEPAYGLFTCGDGKLLSFSIAYEDWFWEALCGALEMDDVAALQRPQRIARADELRARMARILLRHPRAEWERRLAAADAMFAPVLELADVVRDPHLLARGLFTRIAGDPSGQWHVRQPLVFAGGAPGPMRPVPRLGQHSLPVLREAGLDEARIGALLAAGVVLDGAG